VECSYTQNKAGVGQQNTPRCTKESKPRCNQESIFLESFIYISAMIAYDFSLCCI